MKHAFGTDKVFIDKYSKMVDVVYDTKKLINPHTLLLGQSGTGKSFQLRALIESGAEQGLEIDVFDVHNELDVSGSKPVIFSHDNKYGVNPFVVDTTLHAGGIKAAIADFLYTMKEASPGIGQIQLEVLSRLIEDVYRNRYMSDDNKSSLVKQHITEEIRRRLFTEGNWKAFSQYYPVLDDIIRLGEKRRISMATGGADAAVVALQKLQKLQKNLQKKLASQRGTSVTEQKAEQDEIAKMKERAVELFQQAVDGMKGGSELEDYLRYDSAAVLSSVLARLRTIAASGIFYANPPPWGNARVRVHQIKFLKLDEQKLYVYTVLREIYRKRMIDGKKDDVVHAVVVDEAARFFTDDIDNPMNIIAKEARKFGLALWAASQNPDHISDDFLTSCATIVNLGLNSIYRDFAIKKLQMDKDTLDEIQPQSVAAVRLSQLGQNPVFRAVCV